MTEPEPRLAVVTGASSGIGLAAALDLARQGWRVILIGRDPERLADAVKQVRAVSDSASGSAMPNGLRCDFANLDEVRQLAATIRSSYPRIGVLANNAGGVFQGRALTVDGFESTIQVNHLAHFLLSHELRECLRGGRIVNTASGAHQRGALDPTDLAAARSSFRPFRAYGSAKQANILFAAEAARRWPEILSLSYHPGTVRTRFGRDIPVVAGFFATWPLLRTPAKGAQTLVWLATTGADALTRGGYYMDRQLRQPAAKATDPRLAAALWRASLEAVGLPPAD